MYLSQIIYYCFFTLDLSAAVKRRIYVQRQLLSCVTQKAICHSYQSTENSILRRYIFLLRSERYLSVFYFTLILVTPLLHKVAARATTALRIAPTHSVILVANVVIRPPQRSCAEVAYIHLFLICILWLRSHLEAKSWNYATMDGPFADCSCYYSECAYLSARILNFLFTSQITIILIGIVCKTKICGRSFIYLSYETLTNNRS